MTPDANDKPVLLSVEDLRVGFQTDEGALEAVHGISFHVRPGETIVIVGESGSGKSQSMMAAMGLLPKNGRATGRILFHGENLVGMNKAVLNRIRGDRIGMVFQEPMTSLDPLYTIGSQLIEPIMRHQRIGRKAARARALEMLRLVRIPDPERRMDAYPNEMSGGQRQRIAIVRAIILKPRVLLLDEPTSALDRQVQKQIVDLLRGLQSTHALSYLFISHDLAVVRAMADRILVMKNGRVIEDGPALSVLDSPREDYTRTLIAAAFPAGGA